MGNHKKGRSDKKLGRLLSQKRDRGERENEEKRDEAIATEKAIAIAMAMALLPLTVKRPQSPTLLKPPPLPTNNQHISRLSY